MCGTFNRIFFFFWWWTFSHVPFCSHRHQERKQQPAGGHNFHILPLSAEYYGWWPELYKIYFRMSFQHKDSLSVHRQWTSKNSGVYNDKIVLTKRSICNLCAATQIHYNACTQCTCFQREPPSRETFMQASPLLTWKTAEHAQHVSIFFAETTHLTFRHIHTKSSFKYIRRFTRGRIFKFLAFKTFLWKHLQTSQYTDARTSAEASQWGKLPCSKFGTGMTIGQPWHTNQKK